MAARSAGAAQEINGIVTGIIAGSETVQSRLGNSVRAVQASGESRERVAEVMNRSRESSALNFDQATSIAAAAEEQSQVAADMARQVSSNSEDSDGLATIFNELMASISPLRADTDHIFSQLTAKSPCMVLASAKRDHVVWVDKLIRFAVFNERAITEDEVKDHTQCRLGKFLASEEARPLHQLRAADHLVKQVHPQVHSSGKALYKLATDFHNHRVDANRYAEQSRELVDTLKAASSEVLELLDEMIREVSSCQ